MRLYSMEAAAEPEAPGAADWADKPPAATRKRASKLEAKQSKLATARAKVIALEAQMTAKQRSLQVA